MFTDLEKAKSFHKQNARRRDSKYIGFPECYSMIENDSCAELLLEVLGSDLRTLLKKGKKDTFSKPTVYKMIIQLVSRYNTILTLTYRYIVYGYCMI